MNDADRFEHLLFRYVGRFDDAWFAWADVYRPGERDDATRADEVRIAYVAKKLRIDASNDLMSFLHSRGIRTLAEGLGRYYTRRDGS